MKSRLTAAAVIAVLFGFAPFLAAPAAALSPAAVSTQTLKTTAAQNLTTEVRFRRRHGRHFFIRIVTPRCHWREARVCVRWRHGHCTKRAWRLVRVCYRRW